MIDFESHIRPAQELLREALVKRLNVLPGEQTSNRLTGPVCAVIAAKALTGWSGYDINYLENAGIKRREVGEILTDSGAVMARYGQEFLHTNKESTEKKAANYLRNPDLAVDEREKELLKTHYIGGLWISVIFTDQEDEHAVAVLGTANLPPKLKEQCQSNDQMVVVDTMSSSIPSIVQTKDFARWLCTGSTRKAISVIFIPKQDEKTEML